RAKSIASFLHYGSTYKGAELRSSGEVTDGNGSPVPGHVNVRYRYFWGDSDHTDVIFFFDDKAQLYALQMKETTAVLNQPFVLANVSIKVFGALIVGAIGDDLKPEDKKQLEKIIESADAEALMTWSLKFERNVLGK